MLGWIVGLLERRRRRRNVRACLAIVRDIDLDVQRNLKLVDQLTESNL